MSISIGNVLITDLDSPQKIPLGGTLDAQDVKLSDGTRILKITGYTPEDFELTGVMRERDGGADPITKFEELEAMARAHKPVLYTWRGDGASRSFAVLLRSVKGHIIEHCNVEYTISLFRQASSGLVTSGTVANNSRNTQLSNHQRAAARTAPKTGANTQNAHTAAAKATAAIGRRH